MKEKQKIDRNVFPPKKFPVKAEAYQYPPSGIKIGNPIYMTANREYGLLKPTEAEVPGRFYPRDAAYTREFPSNYKFNGLTTAVNFSKVHKAYDEY
jgi:hypothetical protein